MPSNTGEPNWSNQTIWTGDNLEIMRGMNSASVDLIYLDPPFNSKANYAAPIGSKAAGAAFKDIWTLTDVDVEWINLIEAKYPSLYRVLLATIKASDKAYLVYMSTRLLEMHRLLKNTGSIWLHCDPTMSHYLKLVMDAIFGPSQFLNEIIWRRAASHNDNKQGMRRAGKVHDILLLYRKTDNHIWNPIFTAYTQEYLDSEYDNRTDDGRYFKESDLTAAKPGGDTEYEWRVKRPRFGGAWVADIDDEYLNPKSDWEYRAIPPYRGRYWAYSKENLRQFWHEGRLYHRTTGMPRLMLFSDEMPGVPLQDVWQDIPPASGRERTGFRTQKPVALLERIIGLSTNPGDMILDPFCGCATTLVAAEAFELKRHWAGIDISQKAVELVRDRMRKERGLFFRGSVRTDIPQRTDMGQLIRFNDARNKRLLYGEQGGHCRGCDGHFELRHFEVDHIIARAKGGTDHIDNLQLLCGNCNRVKGDRGMEYMRTKLQLPKAA